MREPPACLIVSGGTPFRPAALLLFLLVNPFWVSAQGFGTLKTKVVLHRKLPAVIHLTSQSIGVKTTPHSPQQAEAAQLLTELLQTSLSKNDNSLRLDSSSADVMILCTITNLDLPPRQTFSRNEPVLEKGRPVQRPKTYVRVAGSLDADLKVTDRAGRTLDSSGFSAKYSQEFDSTVNQSSNQTQSPSSILGSIRQIRKPADPAEAPAAPPTPTELQQELVRKIVAQIAPRLVNTDESLEVFLARGKLDEANKLAVSGLWSRYLDSLEMMSPLGSPQDDAYRLFNIGVANEALGYQAEDRASAKKFLQEAAINYGRAIEAKPDDKSLIDAQNRIDLAVTYYRKLEDRNSMQQASSGGGSATTLAKGVDAAGPSSSDGKNSAALTNEKIIEMVKSGVDETDVLAAIRDAPTEEFDMSPDGLIQLAKNGIKGRISAAMRQRAQSPAKTPNSPNAPNTRAGTR